MSTPKAAVSKYMPFFLKKNKENNAFTLSEESNLRIWQSGHFNLVYYSARVKTICPFHLIF